MTLGCGCVRLAFHSRTDGRALTKQGTTVPSSDKTVPIETLVRVSSPRSPEMMLWVPDLPRVDNLGDHNKHTDKQHYHSQYS